MNGALRMSASAWKRKQRIKFKNRGKRNKRTSSGKTMHTTMKTYRKLLRMNKRPRKASTIRKMIRTRKIRQSRFSGYGAHESCQHSQTFLEAMEEFAVQTGRPDLAADILEAIDPSVTGTKVGLYGLDITEKLDSDTVLGEAFVDFFAIDENTLTFVFENDAKIDEASIQHALAPYGKVTILAKPGDALSVSEKSDVFLVSLVVEGSKLEGVKTEFEEGVTVKEDVVEVDEKVYVDDAAYAAIAESLLKIVEN